jgi:TetR/AcrR family transcriptional repressor of nem operon
MAKALTTRERLVAAGFALVHARSANDVSVDDICRRARVNKGSFYHCFKSKTELLLAILEAQEQEYFAEIIAPAFGDDAPPLVKIERLFQLFAEHQQRVKTRQGRALGCLFGNLALELASTDRQVRDRVRAGLQLLADAIEQTLRVAMERGDLPVGDAEARDGTRPAAGTLRSIASRCIVQRDAAGFDGARSNCITMSRCVDPSGRIVISV